MFKEIIVYIFTVIKNTFSRKRIRSKPESNYGKIPDFHYFDDDIKGIRTYFDYRHDNKLDKFLVDETTWSDLLGDDIFKRINQGTSTSGEQYLYYLLRSPAIESDEYEKRKQLIDVIESNPDLRLKLQTILSKLGRRRSANTCEAFKPSHHSPFRLIVYISLVTLLIACAIGIIFSLYFILPLFLLINFNAIYREWTYKRIEKDLDTVQYSVAMVFTAKKIKNLSFPIFESYLSSFYEALNRLKPISRVGLLPHKSNLDMWSELICTLFLLDLVVYEFTKNRLGKYHNDLFHVHEYLGRLDSAIAISSYRKSLQSYCVPQIVFNSSTIHFNGANLVHPLIDNAVPNDFNTIESVLLTGSNASGKSTFLKTVALNAIFAQSICTVLGSHYSAPAFRIYTSMAISDDLLAGESYFISEIKSLKRVTEVDTSQQPLLCVIDEILRGTNTVERIAASSELLRELSLGNTLCLAATHDIELCSMLKGIYKLLHFEETITEDGEVLFDYELKDGPATTRNALKLLDSMGFKKELVKRANEKANRYAKEGVWE